MLYRVCRRHTPIAPVACPKHSAQADLRAMRHRSDLGSKHYAASQHAARRRHNLLQNKGLQIIEKFRLADSANSCRRSLPFWHGQNRTPAAPARMTGGCIPKATGTSPRTNHNRRRPDRHRPATLEAANRTVVVEESWLTREFCFLYLPKRVA